MGKSLSVKDLRHHFGVVVIAGNDKPGEGQVVQMRLYPAINGLVADLKTEVAGQNERVGLPFAGEAEAFEKIGPHVNAVRRDAVGGDMLVGELENGHPSGQFVF